MVLAACDQPIDFATKRCDADHACPSGWSCGGTGFCLEVGPPNTVQNGGFESGLTGWKVTNGTLEVTDGGHNSPSAAVWKPSGGTTASVLTTVAPPIESSDSEWYCARAWVLGSDDNEVEIQLLENGDPGSTTSVNISGGVWKQLKVTSLSGGDALSVALSSSATSGPRTLLVDDLALWKSSRNSSCDKAP